MTSQLCGSVYLLHLEPGLPVTGSRVARHYLGFAEHDVDARIQQHLRRQGSPLVAAVLAAGIGAPGRRLVEAGPAADADLIALSWSRTLAPGRAAMGRQVLAESPIPMLLMPVKPLRVGPRGLRVATNPHRPAGYPG
jgi:hypothetical protein